jgi:predicted nucleic-acid-binding protein
VRRIPIEEIPEVINDLLGNKWAVKRSDIIFLSLQTPEEQRAWLYDAYKRKDR